MKTLRIFSIISFLLITVSLSACKNTPFNLYKQDNSQAQAVTQNTAENNELVIQKIKDNPGVSSATVERLAVKNQCTPNEVVSRLTPAGPVEIYRATCTDGSTFMARCELRQCKAMPRSE